MTKITVEMDERIYHLIIGCLVEYGIDYNKVLINKKQEE